MDIDDAPGQLEEFFDRCRTVLNAQIARARKVVGDLNAEKAAATKAVAELKTQHSTAEAELKTTLADLDRASSLRGLNNEIKKARAELEQLNAATAKESEALAVLVKKRTQEEGRVAALEVAAREAVNQRARSQDLIQQLKAKLGV